MDTSIRFYNANSNLRPVVDAERKGHPAPPLSVDEDSGVEGVDEEAEVVDAHINREGESLTMKETGFRYFG